MNEILIERLASGAVILRLGTPDEEVLTFSPERLLKLQEQVAELQSEVPACLIITGSSPDMFSVGVDVNRCSDLSSTALTDFVRLGQSLCSAVAALPCRTIAAISGPCLGGGCELALACSYRIISNRRSSRIGLPEIKLGIIPGFGGTQRLPRIVGLRQALKIVLAGKSLGPQAAQAVGLVDQVVPHEHLLQQAETIGVRTVKLKRPPLWSEKFFRTQPWARRLTLLLTRRSIQRRTGSHYPALAKAVDAIRSGYDSGMETGLNFEINAVLELFQSAEAKALKHLFSSLQSAKRIGKPARKHLQESKGLVIGHGPLAAALTCRMAQAGLSVIWQAPNWSSSEADFRTLQRLAAREGRGKDKDLLNLIERTDRATPEFKLVKLACLCGNAELEDLARRSNALFEALPAKAVAAVFDCSNFSELAALLPQPGRTIGVNFWDGPKTRGLFEIVCAQHTEDLAVVLCAALAGILGAPAVVAMDEPGALAARLIAAYIQEALHLVAEEAAPNGLDVAARAAGWGRGPLTWLRLRGVHNVVAELKQLEKRYGQRFHYALPEAAILRAAAARNRGALPADKQTTYAERLKMAVVAEAARILADGAAGVPGPDAAMQIDLAAVSALGFPDFLGGPLWHARQQGFENTFTKLGQLSTQYGPRFVLPPGIFDSLKR